MPDEQTTATETSVTTQTDGTGGNGAGASDGGASTATTLTDEEILGISSLEELPADLGKEEEGKPAEELPVGASPPDWLKALYNDPKFGKQAQSLWDRTSAFQQLFQTVQEAKQLKEAIDQVGGVDSLQELVSKAQSVDETDTKFFSGDKTQQAEVVSEMFEEDRDAFESGLVVSLDIIRQRDPERYGRLTSDILTSVLKPERFDEHIEALRESLQSEDPKVLKQLVSTLVGWADSKGLSQKQKPTTLDPRSQQVDKRAKQLEEREQGFRAQQYETMRQSVDSAVRADLTTQITAGLEQILPKVRSAIRERIGKDILGEIDKALRADAGLTQRVLQIIRPTQNQFNFDKATQDRVVNLLSTRAKQLVAQTTRKVVSEWTKDVIARNQATNEKVANVAKRVDITGGAPPGGGAKPKLTRDKAKGMSDEEILNY